MPVGPPLCQSVVCLHNIDWHGQRAGVDPGHCLFPGCRCPAWNPPSPPAPPMPRLDDPHHDRDLYLAWSLALDAVADHGADAGYQIMMAEIARWQRRVFGLPPLPPSDPHARTAPSPTAPPPAPA